MKEKAVILLSGGVDSATTLYIAKNMGFSLYTITFRYGQRCMEEVEAAKRLAHAVRAEEHLVMEVDLGRLGRSALTGGSEVPKGDGAFGPPHQIPVTYVPARNLIFLSLALGWAEMIGSQDIFIGVNAVDFSGYPDCRPAFIKAFQDLSRLATKAGVEGTPVRIHAPVMEMSKGQIIRRGTQLGVDFSMTMSCYDPHEDGSPCLECESCLLRLKGFEEAELKDPTATRKGIACQRE